MRNILTAIIFSLIIFIFFSPIKTAHAQEWGITNFNSHISIKENGTLHVSENIQVNFAVEKHGIFRDIPFIYENEDGSKYYTAVEVENIQRDGEKEEFESTRQGNYLNLKVGDPDKTITGNHTYVIDYKVTGVLTGQNNFDELYWNVTGNYWDVPISKATAKVTIEKGNLIDGLCFQGYDGWTEECLTKKDNNQTLNFSSTRELASGEGMTIVASFPKNTVPLLTVETPMSLGQQLGSQAFLITFLTTLATGLLAIIWNWAKRGRDFIFFGKYLFDPNAKEILKPITHRPTVVVEYTPPEKLKPAELGVLVDERADTLDITSSIVDLAVNGYLKIKEIPKKWLFGKVDYELTRTKKTDTNLEGYEKELLSGLFTSGNTIKVSSLKTTFYDDLKRVKEKLYKDLIKKDYFPHNPESVRNLYFVIFIFLLSGSLFISIFNQTRLYPNVYITGIGAGLFFTGLFGLIFARSMSRRTAKGAELYRRLKGYRLFLENVEKHKQKFLENKNLFNEILPYAIVFGMTGKIASAMEEMGVKPNTPSWYTGAGAFHAASFTNNVSTFSSSVGSSIASTPSSSGFSGGSSGGGFGGGGGGSW